MAGGGDRPCQCADNRIREFLRRFHEESDCDRHHHVSGSCSQRVRVCVRAAFVRQVRVCRPPGQVDGEDPRWRGDTSRGDSRHRLWRIRPEQRHDVLRGRGDPQRRPDHRRAVKDEHALFHYHGQRRPKRGDQPGPGPQRRCRHRHRAHLCHRPVHTDAVQPRRLRRGPLHVFQARRAGPRMLGREVRHRAERHDPQPVGRPPDARTPVRQEPPRAFSPGRR